MILRAFMSIGRNLVVAVLLLVQWLPAAAAQNPGSPQTQIQLQYHEMVAAGADSTPVFLKIIDRINNDCQLVGKAFGKKCMITQLNIYSNANYAGDMSGSRTMNATATIMLLPETAGAPTAPAPAALPPVTR